jgi:hypothetical protein
VVGKLALFFEGFLARLAFKFVYKYFFYFGLFVCLSILLR